MISVSEAKAIIHHYCQPRGTETASLDELAGRILAEPVVAPINLPPFLQSGMDGYAFLYSSYDEAKGLAVTGIVPAGAEDELVLAPGEAARIFTGAPLPVGADTVVMQEHTRREGERLFILSSLQPGHHTRALGAEISKGSVALPAGDRVDPAAIGFLAGMGMTEACVFAFPRVTLLITGNELQVPGQPLKHGQIYESSSYALRAALKNAPATMLDVVPVKDDPEELFMAVSSALERCDVLILTGGVSVGDFDFVAEAVKQAGVTKRFHRIKQKPGKPFFFGTLGKKLVFGLPGNPSSVLTCFYYYVLPALEQLAGQQAANRMRSVPIGGAYRKPTGLTHFLKGRLENEVAIVRNAQESFRLSSFAGANCLICLPEEVETVQAGDFVDIYLLPE